MEFTPDEKDFLLQILGNVVPNMQVAAKDAPAILSMAKQIFDKLNPQVKEETNG